MGLWIALHKWHESFCHIDVPEFHLWKRQTKKTSLAPSYLTDIARFYPSIWQNALSANRSADKSSPKTTGIYLVFCLKVGGVSTLKASKEPLERIQSFDSSIVSLRQLQIVSGFFIWPSLLKISSLNAIEKKGKLVNFACTKLYILYI